MGAPARIDAADDPRVAAFRLNERGLNPRALRRESTPAGMFVAEGDLVVERALAAGCEPLAVLADDAGAERFRDVLPDGVDLLVASEEIRRQVTGLGVALDVVGLFRRPAPRDPADVVHDARRVVVLDQVDNPTNVGAIVRSAAGLGADALLLDRTSADPLTRRALRVSMGAAFVVPTARVEDAAAALEVLHGAGIATVALTLADESQDLTDVARTTNGRPVALLLGAERTGLAPETQAACTARARIQMRSGVDSLNVAAAAAVACFALFGPG